MTKEELRTQTMEWKNNYILKLEKELKAEKEYSATLRKEINEYTNSHTLCAKYKELGAKYKELEKENAELKEQIGKMKSIGRTAYIKGIRTMANRLKEYDRTNGAWTDYFEHTVDEVLKKLLKEIKE